MPTDDTTDGGESEEQHDNTVLSRRTALGLLGVGSLGWMAGSARAQPPAGGSSNAGGAVYNWRRDVDARGHGLFYLGELAMAANPTAITDFEGANLSIDANGVLNAVGVTDTRTDVSDDGTLVVADVEDVDFGANLSVVDDGDGTVTVDASGVSPWTDNDSDNLLEAPGFDGVDVDTVKAGFVETPEMGTTADIPLEAVVNGVRVLRIERTSVDEAPNIIGGHPANAVANPNVAGATIAGGGRDDGTAAAPNTVFLDYGTIGGGYANEASALATVGGGRSNEAWDLCTVCGGAENAATGSSATVGGGVQNAATGDGCTVAGGFTNTAFGSSVTVAGGDNNEGNGQKATIGGGSHNTAGASYTTVSGGQGNTASASHATVGGGGLNAVTGADATVGGGRSNVVEGKRATVGGGENNAADGTASTVGGGTANEAGAESSTVSGGKENAAVGTLSTIGGGSTNKAHDGGTVGGGEDNQAGSTATVGGGQRNQAMGSRTTIAGGIDNTAMAIGSTVGGGIGNSSGHDGATVGGGSANDASGDNSTIGGGNNNVASGSGAVVPGGAWNTASGSYSVAVGWGATTEAGDGTVHDGAVVFADSSTSVHRSNGPNTFTSQMPIYAPSFHTTSARATKEAIEPVDPDEVLERVGDLEVSTWRFRHGGEALHLGPMAEDFNTAFGLGNDGEHIATVDADGVAFAAIQGLVGRLDKKDARIAALEAENEELQARYATLEDRLVDLEQSMKLTGAV